MEPPLPAWATLSRLSPVELEVAQILPPHHGEPVADLSFWLPKKRKLLSGWSSGSEVDFPAWPDMRRSNVEQRSTTPVLRTDFDFDVPFFGTPLPTWEEYICVSITAHFSSGDRNVVLFPGEEDGGTD
ncbi:hypothetical protein N7468_004313 [Penicillium chermesinum]|uniref:Uncharacterized protein n=1 Tax=Penicillium chermesinum TaxID=63820 RepID=A0A9W9TU78_9EURO|nr:uncharacterized protein N7468_004313 [Penicillium chermesinum]KAJ5239694.1 hypothetical protein N7468_004313 [Penicillium chermesinum]